LARIALAKARLRRQVGDAHRSLDMGQHLAQRQAFDQRVVPGPFRRIG